MPNYYKFPLPNLCGLLLFCLWSNISSTYAQTYTQLGTDMTGDDLCVNMDLIALDYAIDAAQDSVWFRFTTVSDPPMNDFAYYIAVNSNDTLTDGTNYGALGSYLGSCTNNSLGDFNMNYDIIINHVNYPSGPDASNIQVITPTMFGATKQVVSSDVHFSKLAPNIAVLRVRLSEIDINQDGQINVVAGIGKPYHYVFDALPNQGHLTSPIGLGGGTTSSLNFNEIMKHTTFDRTSSDLYGWSVSLSGKYAIVGARGDADGLPGNQNVSTAGAAYILEQDSLGSWNEVQKLVASDRFISDGFGDGVKISGNYAIVGAPYEDEDANGNNMLSSTGSVYVFERNESTGLWTEVQKLVASDRAADDYFGYSIGIDGDYIAIGARWEDENPSGGGFLSWAGSVYLFHRNASTGIWVETQKIVASDREDGDQFGYSVDISGDHVIVGAFHEDDDLNGLNSLFNSGAAYLFERNPTTGIWAEVQKIIASDRDDVDNFGNSVAIDGDYAVVGALLKVAVVNGNNIFGAGAAYVYERQSTGNWIEVQKLEASDRAWGDEFGEIVAISGNHILVGASSEDHNAIGGDSLNRAGSAYVFERNPTTGVWLEHTKIVSSDRAPFDALGHAVAIDRSNILLGAPYEDEDQIGQNTLSSAGAVYFFHTCLQFDTNLNLTGNTLSTNEIGFWYQWIDCITNQPIAGANNIQYTPTMNGDYALILNDGTCSDTSNCLSITNVNTDLILEYNQLKVYPNPTQEAVYIDLSDYQEKATVELLNTLGQQLYRETVNSAQIYRLQLPEVKTVYWLRVSFENQSYMQQIIRH